MRTIIPLSSHRIENKATFVKGEKPALGRLHAKRLAGRRGREGPTGWVKKKYVYSGSN